MLKMLFHVTGGMMQQPDMLEIAKELYQIVLWQISPHISNEEPHTDRNLSADDFDSTSMKER